MSTPTVAIATTNATTASMTPAPRALESSPVPADVAIAHDAKADLKARTTVRATMAVAVAVTDVEHWLAANPSASARDRRIAERARDAFRRKLGEK